MLNSRFGLLFKAIFRFNHFVDEILNGVVKICPELL